MNCIQKFLYTLIFVGLPLLLNNYIFQNSLLNDERREIEAIRSLWEFSTLLSRENEELSSGALIRDGENNESKDDGNENDEELKKVLTEIASRANELLSEGDENVKSRLTDLLNEEISKILTESENFIKEEKKKIEIKKENILNGDMQRTRMLMQKLAKKGIIIWEDPDELVIIDDLYEIIDNMLIDSAAKKHVKQLARDFINTKSPFDHVEIYKEIKKYTKSEISRNKKPRNIKSIFAYIKATKLGKALSNPFVLLELAKHISLDTTLHYCLHAVEKISEYIIPSITMSIILLYYIIVNRSYLKSLIMRTKTYKKNKDESNQNDTSENIIEDDEDKITTEENITAAKKEDTVNVKKQNETKKQHAIDKKKIKYIMRVTIYLSKENE
ncbi:hypothetical protein YYG_01160 [Plasmodium vinckei petteri]|uniref:Uncharacterized protein n=1 Tax=Plasmodium vinckei petteri TaxID=138298 RepID=W7AMN0_PLAVN|nr:hypothetical protein YYG_01160 [Plasmodium vinckei petteri]CAD2108032.1 Plasmodium exported protein, unknown function [Plasmodium vinckei petteri]